MNLLAIVVATTSLFATDGIEVRAFPMRTDLVVGEPLVLCVEVQNNGDRPVELSRERAMSAVIFIREKGAGEFELASRGRYYREGFEVDGTDSWTPKMQWSWDEWIVSRKDAAGNPVGPLFDRPGEFDVRVSVRVDHSSIHTRGWRDTNVVSITVSPRRNQTGAEVPAPSPEVQRILERGINGAKWREEVAALENLEGELVDYASFRVGEGFYYAASGWINLDSHWRSEYGSAESAARRSIESLAKLSDRCPGLRRRAAFRMIALLGHPGLHRLVDFDRLVESFHLAVPLPHQPLDPFDKRQSEGHLRRLGILFASDARLDTKIHRTENGTTWGKLFDSLGQEARLRIYIDETTRNSTTGDLGEIDMPLRNLLYTHSTEDTWWELRNGAVCLVQQNVAKPPMRH